MLFIAEHISERKAMDRVLVILLFGREEVFTLEHLGVLGVEGLSTNRGQETKEA